MGFVNKRGISSLIWKVATRKFNVMLSRSPPVTRFERRLYFNVPKRAGVVIRLDENISLNKHLSEERFERTQAIVISSSWRREGIPLVVVYIEMKLTRHGDNADIQTSTDGPRCFVDYLSGGWGKAFRQREAPYERLQNNDSYQS